VNIAVMNGSQAVYTSECNVPARWSTRRPGSSTAARWCTGTIRRRPRRRGGGMGRCTFGPTPAPRRETTPRIRAIRSAPSRRASREIGSSHVQVRDDPAFTATCTADALPVAAALLVADVFFVAAGRAARVLSAGRVRGQPTAPAGFRVRPLGWPGESRRAAAGDDHGRPNRQPRARPGHAACARRNPGRRRDSLHQGAQQRHRRASAVARHVTTAALGRFSESWRVSCSRRLWFIYDAGGDRANATLLVRVRAGVELSATPAPLSNFQKVTLSGQLHGPPMPSGAIVELQVFRSTGWETFGTANTTARGVFSFAYQFFLIQACEQRPAGLGSAACSRAKCRRRVPISHGRVCRGWPIGLRWAPRGFSAMKRRQARNRGRSVSQAWLQALRDDFIFWHSVRARLLGGGQCGLHLQAPWGVRRPGG
jgi:hypothetical protein